MRSGRQKRAALPDFIKPCLATAASAPPSGEEWAHEIKFDGYRLQARVENTVVTLRTRTGLDWTEKFDGIAGALSKIKAASAIIDGEAIVEDVRGAPNFSELVSDLKAGRSNRIAFVAFDLLYLNGVDVRPSPLRDRKALLKQLFRSERRNPRLRYSDHQTNAGPAMLLEACKNGLEGIVSKRLDKPYRAGRGADWLKSKCVNTDEFVIAGYLDSTAIKNSVGALALGYYDGARLIYAGRVGTGFNRRTASDIWRELQPLRNGLPAFAQKPDAIQSKGVNWVKPHRVAQIEYRAWTSDGVLRHASFKALRDDKPARGIARPRLKR
jgi:bifunctional non-homologous end joining protein LigD